MAAERGLAGVLRHRWPHHGGFAVFAVVSAVVDPTVAGWALLLAVMTGAVAVGFFLYAFRVCLSAADDGLIVRSLSAETRIPWDDIVDCAPGYFGIRITRRDGSSVNASAVQRPNYAVWLKRESRADRVAAEIRRRAKSAGSSST